MAIVINDIKTALYNWAVSISDIPVIWQYDNGPKPGLSFIALQIISLTQIGLPWVQDRTSVDKILLANFLNLELNIQAYGQNSIGDLEKFTYANYIDGVSDDLRASVGLSLLSSGIIQDITAINDRHTSESRATIDLTFNFANDAEIDVSTIESVDISGKIIQIDKTERNNNFLVTT
jgi:hypothetical protein